MLQLLVWPTYFKNVTKALGAIKAKSVNCGYASYVENVIHYCTVTRLS